MDDDDGENCVDDDEVKDEDNGMYIITDLRCKLLYFS